MDEVFQSPQVGSIIKLALEEDAAYQDITSLLCLPGEKGEAPAKAQLLLKEDAIICGLPLIDLICRIGKAENLRVTYAAKDTEAKKSGSILADFHGAVADILRLERTILNFLQRLSGVATQAGKIAKSFPGIKILDTRKTTPGLRLLEKYAVRCGGLENHRMSLGDMILIKDNHVDAAKLSISDLLHQVASTKPPGVRIEIEVRDMKEFLEALGTNIPDSIMLDNFTPDLGEQAYVAWQAYGGRKPAIEVSGGLTEEKIKSWSKFPEVYFSMGALTNKVHAVDISLKIQVEA